MEFGIEKRYHGIWSANILNLDEGSSIKMMSFELPLCAVKLFSKIVNKYEHYFKSWVGGISFVCKPSCCI